MVLATSSNPISSVPDQSNSPISSVPEYSPTSSSVTLGNTGAPAYSVYPPSITNNLHLDLRGTRMSVDRETLMTLPESVLLSLFPNGLVLSPQPPRQGPARVPQSSSLATGADAGGQGEARLEAEEAAVKEPSPEPEEDSEVYVVDYDPASFRFVLDFWQDAHSRFYGQEAKNIVGVSSIQQSLLHPSGGGAYPYGPSGSQGAGAGYDSFSPGGLNENPLIQKQPIIVLREELEYFSIPPPSLRAGQSPAQGQVDHPMAGKATTNDKGLPSAELLRLKLECGKQLLSRQKVFTALQRNVSKEGNMAEQHLIDMLCMSGFSREDDWGYRALEPNRCCISSIALVLLKTGITHETDPKTGQPKGPVEVDHMQMATAQKLLLFWRKPARKCWWDGVVVDVPISDGSKETAPVKVWARRVWTLELSLI